MKLSRLLDVSVFVSGIALLVVGVGLFSIPAALVVLGSTLMGTVIAARVLGVNKS